MSACPPTLIGDGIENPFNAQAMMHAADMFGCPSGFRDRVGLAASWVAAIGGGDLPLITGGHIAASFAPLAAFENVAGAADVYGFRLPGAGRPAVVVGNERTGIGRDLLAAATHLVRVPMVSRRINTINVAAAAAVALYYLTRGGGGKLHVRADPRKHRPDLLFLGAVDHVELGSGIRSSCAFGWGRAFIEDRNQVWFGADRGTRTEGRAAARRARNAIRLIPTTPETHFGFEEACVITLGTGGIPLHRANLARGPRQVIVIPDESAVKLEDESLGRLAKTVTPVYLPLPVSEFVYHYRLIASIVLAEVARQVGRAAAPIRGRPGRHLPLYDKSLRLLIQERGETVFLDELVAY